MSRLGSRMSIITNEPYRSGQRTAKCDPYVAMVPLVAGRCWRRPLRYFVNMYLIRILLSASVPITKCALEYLVDSDGINGCVLRVPVVLLLGAKQARHPVTSPPSFPGPADCVALYARQRS